MIMEDKLKKILDGLDEKETDKLLGDIKECDTGGLNVDNIMKRVYEGTGVKSSVEMSAYEPATDDKKTGNSMADADMSVKKVIPWKRISIIAGMAASFVLVFVCGFLVRDNIGNKETDNAGQQFAAVESNEKSDDVAEMIPEDSIAGETEMSEESEASDSAASDMAVDEGAADYAEEADQATEEIADDAYVPDDSKDSSKEDKKDERPGKTSHDSIAAGEGDDSYYLDLPGDEVEDLINNSTDEIDMEETVSGYASLDDMIDHVDYIVKGVKASSSFKKAGGKHKFALVSKVYVSNVIYNNTDDDIRDTIKVEEGIIYDSKRECYTHIYGYARMKIGGEYVLFLKKSGKVYNIAEVVYGKVPVDRSEDVMCLDSGYVPSQNVMNAKNIIEKARSRYIDGPNVVTHEERRSKSDSQTTGDKSDKSSKNDKKDKSGKNDKSGKADKSDKTDKSDDSATSDDAGETDNGDKTASDQTSGADSSSSDKSEPQTSAAPDETSASE